MLLRQSHFTAPSELVNTSLRNTGSKELSQRFRLCTYHAEDGSVRSGRVSTCCACKSSTPAGLPEVALLFAPSHRRSHGPCWIVVQTRLWSVQHICHCTCPTTDSRGGRRKMSLSTDFRQRPGHEASHPSFCLLLSDVE